MRPRTAFPLVTTREPMFFTRNQSAALLMLASGSIVATSAPFRLRMVSTVIAASLELPAPPRGLSSKDERAPFPIDWQRTDLGGERSEGDPIGAAPMKWNQCVENMPWNSPFRCPCSVRVRVTGFSFMEFRFCMAFMRTLPHLLAVPFEHKDAQPRG